MAFAPAVSIEYWQELAERRAELTYKQETEDAAYTAIVADQLDKVAEIFEANEEHDNAKLVKSL